MKKLFLYLEAHKDTHNPLMIEFLLIYPAINAFFSLKSALLSATILTILLIFVKTIMALSLRIFPEVVAHILSIIFIVTYSSSLFLILSALIPNQFRIIILPITFLIVNSIIESKSTSSKHYITYQSGLFDGLFYLIKSMFFITSLYLFSLLDFTANRLAFAFFGYTLTYMLYNTIVYIVIKHLNIELSDEE